MDDDEFTWKVIDSISKEHKTKVEGLEAQITAAQTTKLKGQKLRLVDRLRMVNAQAEIFLEQADEAESRVEGLLEVCKTQKSVIDDFQVRVQELEAWGREAVKVMGYFKKEKAVVHLCIKSSCDYCGCHVMAYDSRHLIERCSALQAFKLKVEAHTLGLVDTSTAPQGGAMSEDRCP